jgi:hypothetical protein
VKSRSRYLDENGFTTVSGMRGNPGSVLRWRASDRIKNEKRALLAIQVDGLSPFRTSDLAFRRGSGRITGYSEKAGPRVHARPRFGRLIP